MFSGKARFVLSQCASTSSAQCQLIHQRLGSIMDHVAVRSYRAAVLKDFNKDLVVETQKRELVPGDRELLVQVDSAGINNVDLLMCQGKYHQQPQLPMTPGYELAGEVVKVGKAVKEFSTGDRVLGIKTVGQGAFSEQCIINVNAAHLIPHSLKYEHAVSIPVAYGSAYLALKKANVKEGDYVLVLASAGSTGTACVDLAVNVFKCKVIAAAENESKCAIVRNMGVLSTVEYTDENLPKLVSQITNGELCRAVIDTVGGFWFDLALQCVAPDGHLVTTGFTSGQVPLLTMSNVIKYRASVSGVRLSGLAEDNPKQFHHTIDKIIDWKENGYYYVLDPKTFKLDEINEAMKYMRDEKPFGKVVLICRT